MRQTLSDDAANALFHAARIIYFQGFALIIAVIEFRKVTLQMLRADMVICANDAAFQDRKIALNRVCVSVAANIFVSRMIENFVTRNPCAYDDTGLHHPSSAKSRR